MKCFVSARAAKKCIAQVARAFSYVYQPYVGPCVQYAVLPTTLSGSYTLVLSDDTYLFTGMIDLE